MQKTAPSRCMGHYDGFGRQDRSAVLKGELWTPAVRQTRAPVLLVNTKIGALLAHSHQTAYQNGHKNRNANKLHWQGKLPSNCTQPQQVQFTVTIFMCSGRLDALETCKPCQKNIGIIAAESHSPNVKGQDTTAAAIAAAAYIFQAAECSAGAQMVKKYA